MSTGIFIDSLAIASLLMAVGCQPTDTTTSSATSAAADQQYSGPARAAYSTSAQTAWQRHAIDDRFDGPDGTKIGDLNGDNRPDIVTGWESEGLTLAYVHPNPAFVRRSWPSVVVGPTPKAEDAVFVDLDRDGHLDVVSSCEQGVEKVFVHWNPGDPTRLLHPQAWRQQSLPAVAGVSQWMFAEPIQLTADGPWSLVIGGKNYEHDQTAVLGLLTPDGPPGDADNYKWVPLADVSWVMSIKITDVNGDGAPDILYSDKHGPGCGVWWLENPARASLAQAWRKWPITSGDLDGSMLLDLADVDQDGLVDVVTPVDLKTDGATSKQRRIRISRRLDAAGQAWETHDVEIAPFSGQPKAVTIGDVNGDGWEDLVVTSTGAEGGQMGVYWLMYESSPWEDKWHVHRIAGNEGIKFDLVHLLDLDEDGDLDVVTSEEKQDKRGLGVVWYENPLATTEVAFERTALDTVRAGSGDE